MAFNNLVKGAFNRSQVGTLVERKTLFTLLVQLDNDASVFDLRPRP